jgi:hypothetical protein
MHSPCSCIGGRSAGRVGPPIKDELSVTVKDSRKRHLCMTGMSYWNGSQRAVHGLSELGCLAIAPARNAKNAEKPRSGYH